MDLSAIEADLLLYIDEWAPCLPRGLDRINMPTAAFFTDVVHDLPRRRRLAPFFDHIFVAHADYLDKFDNHPSVRWLPYGVDSSAFGETSQRDLDVAFVGSPMGCRSDILKAVTVRHRTNDFWKAYSFEEMVAIYHRAKIVFNMGTKGEVTMRVFEATACGALLLTERSAPGLAELFAPDLEIATYDAPGDVLATIDHWLRDDRTREKVAAAGLAACRERHTWEVRVQTILNAIGSNAQPIAPIRTMSENNKRSAYASAYAELMMLDELFELVTSSPEHSLPSVGDLFQVGRGLARRGRRLGWRRLLG